MKGTGANVLTRPWFCAVLCALISGCSGNDQSQETRGDHVWKAQTDALEKAKQIEQQLQDAAQKRRERMESGR